MSDRRDPTRSAGLRKRGRGLVSRKIFSLHKSLRQVFVEQDVVGLRARDSGLPGNIMLWLESNQNRLARGEMVTRDVIGREISNAPHWLWNVMSSAVRLGVEQAAKELKVSLGNLDDADVADTHGYAATAEVIGIAQETERRLIRHAVHAVEREQTPEVLMREVRNTLEKITRLRMNLLVNTAVVRAVNAGKLFTYQAAGITQVGIDPEWVAPKLNHRQLHDARKKAKRIEVMTVAKLLAELGAISEEEEAAAEQAVAIPEQVAAPEDDTLVQVLTAGDDHVCDDCDEIAASGPYEIEEARDLIPAHPNCRCAFVPFGDKRFAPIAEQEED